MGCYSGFSLSGRISDAAGLPIAGVVLEAAPVSVATDAAGEYEIWIPVDWSGVLVPEKDYCEFAPEQRSYLDVASDLTDQDFTVLRAFGASSEIPTDIPTLAGALEYSLTGDTITLAPGIYSGDGFTDLNPKGKSLLIRGKTKTDSTIIDLGATPGSRAFRFEGEADSACTIAGLTISGATGDLTGQAVICSDGASPTFINVIFRDNVSSATGGALASIASAPSLRSCTFHGNSAEAGGAAIFVSGDLAPMLDRVLITGTLSGGGILVEGPAAPSLVCCDVWGNAGGDYLGETDDPTGSAGNQSIDPLYCDLAAGDLHLSGESPCLPDFNTCGEMIGALGQGCVGDVPSELYLGQNYPNPFNPSTAIRFGLPEARSVTLTIFDLSGRRITTLLDAEPLAAGYHSRIWNGMDHKGERCSTGVYFSRVEAGGSHRNRKMSLLK